MPQLPFLQNLAKLAGTIYVKKLANGEPLNDDEKQLVEMLERGNFMKPTTEVDATNVTTSSVFPSFLGASEVSWEDVSMPGGRRTLPISMEREVR